MKKSYQVLKKYRQENTIAIREMYRINTDIIIREIYPNVD